MQETPDRPPIGVSLKLTIIPSFPIDYICIAFVIPPTGGNVSEAEYVEMSLRQLKLRPGIALQTQCSQPESPKEEAHFLAAIDGKGVMVTHEGRAALSVGSDCRVCGFTGQYDFHFSAPVLQTFEAPFAYALLAYPGAVRARKVRQAARMKVSLAASVRVAGNGSPTPATILDLSIFGAMLHTSTEVGGVGDALQIDVEFMFEIEPVHLSLASTIRHNQRAEAGGYHLGVSFRDVATDDKLLLHYLAYSTTHQDAA